jgi:transposase-like protein
MSGTKGMSHYSYAVKREAVRLHEEESLSYAEITSRLQIRKRDRVERWVQQFRQEGEAGLKKRSGGPQRKRLNEAERIARLEMENALLKKYHTELRKLMPARRDIGSSNTTEEATR